MIKNKIIIIPIEGDFAHSADFLRQTALTLAKHNQVYIYDQINSYFWLKNKPKIEYPASKNLHFHQVKYFLPGRRLPWLEQFNRKLSWHLFLAKFGAKNKILWFFYPNYYDLAQTKDKNNLKIYDCVDYQEDLGKEKKLVNNVDYFFVNSEVLFKLHQKQSKKPILLSAQGFFEPNEKLIKKSPLTFDKPVIGFVGGLNYRLDFALLDMLIKNNPQWQFVLYGPVQKDQKKDPQFKTEKWLQKISKYKNLLIGMSNNRYDLYGIIKQFDVAIIPYNTQILFNKYCYPMKVFEYLYFGKAILSTEIEELKNPKFKSFIFTSDKFKDWPKQLEMLLKKKPHQNLIKKQKKLARENSWQRKLEQISNFIS
jgi:hypothetical protein